MGWTSKPRGVAGTPGVENESRPWAASSITTPAHGPRARAGAEPGSGSFLSVVVPAKNEATGLPQLVGEIADALRPLCRGKVETESEAGACEAEAASEREEAVACENPGRRLGGFEIVVVDDGSTDDTREVLRRLSVDYPELRPLILAVNVGQSAATAAGFWAARGDWIATLDADLQNDPADLVLLWESLPGHDVALGWRARRQDVWSKRVISRWANRVRNWVLGQSIRDTGCSVRIFPRELALRLPMFHGSHRFLGPLLLREGCRLIQTPVHHRARPHGQSHYNIWNRSLKVIVDLFGVAWLMRRPVRFQTVDAREVLGGPLGVELEGGTGSREPAVARVSAAAAAGASSAAGREG
jgi:glycosyltransferase involved in cell wall biosynthesis